MSFIHTRSRKPTDTEASLVMSGPVEEQSLRMDFDSDPHAVYTGMDTNDFFADLGVEQNLPPATAAATAAAPVAAAEVAEAMQVDPPSRFADKLMQQFAGMVRGPMRVTLTTPEEREAKEEAENAKKTRQDKERERRLHDKDTPYGTQVIKDINNTGKKTDRLGIPGFETLAQSDLQALARKHCTIVTYTDGENEVTCTLAEVPAGIEDHVTVLELRDDQVKCTVLLLKNVLRHGLSLLTSGVGGGKTYTAIALGVIARELGLADFTVVVSPNQLTGQWMRSIAQMAGSDHEIFHVNCESIKMIHDLEYNIHASKSKRKFIIVDESLLNNRANAPMLTQLFSIKSMKAIVLYEEFHLYGRNPNNPRDMIALIFSHFKSHVYISATPVVSGDPRKEEEVMLTTTSLMFDHRCQEIVRNNPRVSTKVDTRKCSAVQLQQIVKELSVSSPPDGEHMNFPPGAVYKVMACPTFAKGTVNPRKELCGNGVDWGTHQRLLTLVALAKTHFDLLRALYEGNVLEEPGSVLVVVSNVTALIRMSTYLTNMGYAKWINLVHGQMSLKDRTEGIRRLHVDRGVITFTTPELAMVGHNLQHYNVALSACEDYTPQNDKQLRGRLERPPRKSPATFIYITTGEADDRVAELARNKEASTAYFYDANPVEKHRWLTEPTAPITEDEIKAVVCGIYASVQAGFAPNLRCATPMACSKLIPPGRENEASLMEALEAFVCPEFLPVEHVQGFNPN
jgi:hypothetical protein